MRRCAKDRCRRFCAKLKMSKTQSGPKWKSLSVVLVLQLVAALEYWRTAKQYRDSAALLGLLFVLWRIPSPQSSWPPVTTFVLFWWSQVAAGLQVRKEVSGELGPGLDCSRKRELWSCMLLCHTSNQVFCFLWSSVLQTLSDGWYRATSNQTISSSVP